MSSANINIHADLIERSKSGDQIAQYELYKLYVNAMYNTSLRIVGNQEDAEDILQESFVSAFKNLNSYRADASFGAWLKRIVVNNSLNFVKKSQRNLEVLTEPDEQPFEDFPEEYPLTVQQVKESISQLPAGFRSVLTLYLFEGYDHQEIAEIMGISVSTSKTQYMRAKEKLRGILIKEVKYG